MNYPKNVIPEKISVSDNTIVVSHSNRILRPRRHASRENTPTGRDRNYALGQIVPTSNVRMLIHICYSEIQVIFGHLYDGNGLFILKVCLFILYRTLFLIPHTHSQGLP